MRYAGVFTSRTGTPTSIAPALASWRPTRSFVKCCTRIDSRRSFTGRGGEMPDRRRDREGAAERAPLNVNVRFFLEAAALGRREACGLFRRSLTVAPPAGGYR